MIRISTSFVAVIGLVGGLTSGGLAYSQSAPRFEVASVKASTERASGGGVKSGKGRLTVESETLKRCIMGAYSVGPNQISGGPKWLETDRFEIVAKAEQPVGDAELMKMLQTLLAERFQLVVHRETKIVQSLALEPTKNGPKLKETESAQGATNNGRGRIEAKAITMKRFAEVLSRQTDLPVVDHTGIEGKFDLKLEWSPESMKPANANGASESGPSLFTAIQEQLGLRLQAQKAPIEMLVIDRAEKPSEN